MQFCRSTPSTGKLKPQQPPVFVSTRNPSPDSKRTGRGDPQGRFETLAYTLVKFQCSQLQVIRF